MPAAPWTSETARAAALKSHANRAARRAAAAKASTPASAPAPPRVAPDTYVSSRLARVRSQLREVDALISQASAAGDVDAGALERLTRASAQLQAQEQALAGRPGPGQLRPVPAPAADEVRCPVVELVVRRSASEPQTATPATLDLPDRAPVTCPRCGYVID